MNKSTTVSYTLYEGEQSFNIPLRYKVKTQGENYTYVCKVDMQDNEIPDWLTVSDFIIPHVYTKSNPQVLITSFSEVKGIGNVDTALFITRAENQISVLENKML